MWYQAYRNARKRGRKNNTTKGFDRSDYESVLRQFGTSNNPGKPTHPNGYSVLNQCLCGILKLYEEQHAKFTNSFDLKDIKTEKVRKLMQMSRDRVVRTRRKNYVEKVDKELQPYINNNEFPRLEKDLWNSYNNINKPLLALMSLRNRECLLSSKSGILRGESLFYCELSDLLDLKIPSRSDDPTPYHVLATD